ncbi:MAG: TIGR03032 family protein [Anaerolineae bacterium]|jgi:uncharacterized protein (TIGR03032 family)
MDHQRPSSASTPSQPIDVVCSRYFTEWLHKEQISLGFTTYQTHRLFLVGLKPDSGRLSAFERLFDRAMGLTVASPDRLYMSERYRLWQFDNALAPGETYNGYDKLYVPRVGHVTGELDVHDLAVDADKRLIFVNTLYSCLATLSDRYSFTPVWQPPFISRLAPEDRCHLNGLAMVAGEPRYVTAVSRSDVASGWRERRQDGGCVIDVASDEVIVTGLSMPHSPRWYRGRLWVQNSGTGEFGYVDLDRGEFEPVAFCPGYLRGMAFHGDWALVGLSKPRERTFTGLELQERLSAKDAAPRCGLMAIDLETGNVVNWMDLRSVVTELYDVQVLPGVRCPMSLGFKTDEVRRIIAVDQAPSAVLHTLSLTDEPQPDSKAAPPPPVPHPTVQRDGRDVTDIGYRYQVSLDMTVAAAIQEYESLTFPSIRQQSQVRAFAEPLVAIAVSHGAKPVGMALAEITPAGESARVLSMRVAPEHRRRGVGTKMLGHLERTLGREGCSRVTLSYRSNWSSVPAIERLLEKANWPPAVTHSLICKTDRRIAQAPWFSAVSLPDGFEAFPWVDLTAEEKEYMERRQKEEEGGWYPDHLTPFQVLERLEAANSLGLRHEGRVVGWMITHRTAPDTVQYTSLFLDRGVRGQGLALPFVIEAIRRQAAVEKEAPYGLFQVEVDNEKMMSFLDHFLRPYMESQVELRLTGKRLR